MNTKIYLIITFLTAITSLFSCSSKTYPVDPMFYEMRDISFTVNPQELGMEKEYKNQIYAVIMESGYEDGAYSLRCYAEGTISIFFTNGGGMIGIGGHEEARDAGMSLIKESQTYWEQFRLTEEYPLPREGETIFYLLTFAGVFSYTEKETVLEKNRSVLSPLYYKAQEVITQARLIDEARGER